jgi:hypothetical protein
MSRKSRVLVVGAVTTVFLLGAAVIGAVTTFEDLAIWGANGGHNVNTPARARVIDLQLATFDLFLIPTTGTGCDTTTFSDNLTTPVIEGTIEAGSGGGRYVCLENTGGTANQPITVKLNVTDVSDIDTDCTGQEADFDQTCGDNGAGEAKPLFSLRYAEINCATAANITTYPPFSFSQPTTDVTLFANQVANTPRCFEFFAYHSQVPVDELLEQAGQSDKLSFTLTFKGQHTTGS